MMLKFTGIYSVVVLLVGCAFNGPLEQQHSQLSDKLTETENRLVTTIDRRCQVDQQKLAATISALIKTEKTPTYITPLAPEIVYLERCSQPSMAGNTMFDDKLILGQIETVTLTKEQRTLDARIDTGAVTSSLGVFNLNRFERDGKKWVEFSLDDNKSAATFKYPIKRFIRIAIPSASKADRREVIELNFSFGNESYGSEFSLADRKHLDYQVLIGREFLLDRAVVDVSGKYMMKRK